MTADSRRRRDTAVSERLRLRARRWEWPGGGYEAVTTRETGPA
jgi:hypothetical protein